MVNKITTPPTTSELISKVNELVDDKQDKITSDNAGTGIDITNDVISVDSTVVTTNTAQDITARKTFFGEKAIYFKQNTASNKLGFTLYDNNNKEVGALEFRPNTIGSTPILTLNSEKPSSTSYVGFRYWDYNLNILAPFSTSFRNKNLFIPVTFTNGTTTVESTSTDGSVDISSLLPTVNNATLTITQGGVSKGTFTANASSDVTIALDAGGGGGSYTAGTGIDITSDVISVTSAISDGAAAGLTALQPADVTEYTAAEVQTLWESL